MAATTKTAGANPSENRDDVLKPRFVPTPERVSQYLEKNTEQVMTEMTSVEGRTKLFQDLLKHQKDLMKIDPRFNPEDLQRQLDLVGETLGQKQRYLKDVQSVEKKGVMRRTWDKMKGFAKKHPVVTTLLVLSAAAGGVAAGFYLAGEWELLMASTGLQKVFGSAEAASELIPPTPMTPPLPGGGVFEVPLPESPADIGNLL